MQNQYDDQRLRLEEGDNNIHRKAFVKDYRVGKNKYMDYDG